MTMILSMKTTVKIKKMTHIRVNVETQGMNRKIKRIKKKIEKEKKEQKKKNRKKKEKRKKLREENR